MVVKPILRAAILLLFFSIAGMAATIVVPAGGDLQAAINAAQSGDTIIVDAGSIYSGGFILPNKSGTAFITIQSSRASELPVGTRVSPAQASLLATLRNSTVDTAAPVIRTSPGSHHWRLIGLDIATSTNAQVYDLIQIGTGTQTATEVPNNIEISRSWIHGYSSQEVQRGVSLNGSEITIADSYINEIHGTGYDTQALCGWNGPGPFHIVNNYLEAAGENILFGGADPSIANLIPSNIEIRYNYVFKPLKWKVGDPSYAGIHWSVKNLLELKMARNVMIDGNTFENSWGDAQIGYAILFTVRNQDGKAPWAIIENVTFTNNIIKNSDQGFQLLGSDNLNPSQRCTGLLIRNNLFQGISNRFLTMTGYNNVTLEHNTHEQGGNIMSLYGETFTGFSYVNNVTFRNPNGYGIFGDSVGEGTAALEKYAPGYDLRGNVIAGALSMFYPSGNFYPSDLSNISSYKGTDGLVPGFMGVTVSPTPTPVPSPSPSATPTPSPSPTATPLPSPTPPPSPSPIPSCSMTVNSPVLAQWSSGKLVVNVSGFSSPSTLTATQTSGQVTVDPPTSRSISGSSVIVEFGLQAKKKSSSVIVSGPCGSQTVNVTVR
jgi:hypothetical protein